jgi:hypothetical protein
MTDAVFIDPPSADFFGDQLFDTGNTRLNRDGTLEPYARLQTRLAKRGIACHTADFLRDGRHLADNNHYWSLGATGDYSYLIGRTDVRMRGIIVFEPPLVMPGLYKRVADFTRDFETVYIHNTIGAGYPLGGVDATKLRQLFWPQPFATVDAAAWPQAKRINKLVVISGNHRPKYPGPEFYSKRIDAVAALAGDNAIDLYGRGWSRWSRQSAWWPYLRNRRSLLSVYRGECRSKAEVLGRYRFSLCLENMPLPGYVSEKLFDCLYAGTVPLYLGAPDIAELIPTDAFVDLRDYPTWQDAWHDLHAMPEARWQAYRDAGRAFIEGPGFARYYDALSMIEVVPPVWTV